MVGWRCGLGGAAFGLAGCDADYGLANAGVGHFREKGCAVRENSDTCEEGGGGAAVALEGPGYFGVFGASVDSCD